MMIWYVHRRDDGSIASAHGEPQEGYAEEPVVEGQDGELDALLARSRNAVPADIANWQAHAILEIRGKLSTVNAAIDAIQDPTTRIVVRRGFDGADRIPRNSPNLNAVLKGPMVGMTDAEIDQLFIDASKLHA